MLPRCRWSLATNATRRIAQYVPGLMSPSPWTARIPTLGHRPAATLRAWVLPVAFCGLLALAAGAANATAETGMAAMEVPSPQQQTLAGLEGLAEYFFPLDLWFHPYEWCSWPATRRNPGVAVYRVREHPNDPSMLSITYSLLYKNDCGGSLNIESHPGDVESFSYTLVPDPECGCGWRLFAVKTTAHGGELGNVGVRIVNSCEPLPELFVSRKKHGTYVSMEKCNQYFDPAQRCERGFSPDFVLINAGDPDDPKADDLSAYFPSEPLAPTEYIWSGDGRFCGGQEVLDRMECVASPGSKLVDDSLIAPARQSTIALVGLGDSLTHGTMDGTNNELNTLNAYLQKVGDSLGAEMSIALNQPLFDEQENRISPFVPPSNLGVDGSDIFSLEGIQYYKRVAAPGSYVTGDYLCDKLLPSWFTDKYDKVLYPINVLARQPVSQLDAAIWLLREGLAFAGIDRAFIVLWSGNNDSSKAALGAGGKNPEFQPLPLDLIWRELDPVLALLLFMGQHNDEVSFEPYTMTAIERNLTELEDFEEQYIHVLNRLMDETADSGVTTDLFALTLPYYSAVGYLMDSEDLEFYLRKVDPMYGVPETFKRVAPPGKPIADPLAGDRISLLTFGMMYALLSTGYSSDTVNRVLEINGQQRDGLVLSEAEQRHIMSRIDGFNEAIEEASASLGPGVHLIDIGRLINDMFTGKTEIEVGDRVLTRKWVRGSGFSLDGVHPGYTAQAFLANFIVERMNEALGLDAPPTDLVDTLSMDPYVDWDGDGWAPGLDYEPPGITRLIFLFRDPDDTNPDVGVEMPPDVWGLISNVLLGELLDIPAIRERAETLGLVPVENEPGTE